MTDANYLDSGSSFTLTCTIQQTGATLAMNSPSDKNCAFCDPPDKESLSPECQGGNYVVQCIEKGGSFTMKFNVEAAGDEEFGDWRCTEAGSQLGDSIDILRFSKCASIFAFYSQIMPEYTNHTCP